MYIFICIELDGQVTHVPNRPTQSFVQHCDAGELCMFTAFWQPGIHECGDGRWCGEFWYELDRLSVRF